MEEQYDKSHYALQLAFQFPSVSFDTDTGAEYMEPHYTFWAIDRDSDRLIEEFGLSEKAFYRQERIMDFLDAYDLNREQFWYAVVYVMLLTRMWAEQKAEFLPLPPTLDQLRRIREEISKVPRFKIVIENPEESHSVPVEGVPVISKLVSSLDSIISEMEGEDKEEGFYLASWEVNIRMRLTEKTWYAANMFHTLLVKALKLPTKRARGEKGKNGKVSYDKNQLIAELIHFLHLTENDGLDGNSIKGILKKPFNGVNGNYIF